MNVIKIHHKVGNVERATKILRVAAVLAIVALALMMWSLVDPTPAPVLIALSVGQAIGTLSFMAYLVVVLWDVRRLRREARERASSAPPPSS